MKNFDVDSLLEICAEQIFQRILELNIVSKDDLIPIIKSNIVVIISDMALTRNQELKEDKKKILETMFKLKGHKRIEQQNKLTELNTQISYNGTLHNGFREKGKLVALVKWVRETYGDASMEKFYKEHPETARASHDS